MNWSGRHVVLGVSGGIASYKSCYLARRLTEAGARVDVVLTRGATEFIRPVTFEALTGRPVITSLWERGEALSHIRLGQAELVIVAPATAHLVARVAQGQADDFLTALLLARQSQVLLAPAMNDDMFAHPATQANLLQLKQWGFACVGPEIGPLAEGASDRPGRMSEPETILAHAARLLQRNSRLSGRNVVITAGPTREAIDPVRVVTNRSSGKMGFRLAEAAWERGADVTLISGPVQLVPPPDVTLVRTETTEQMQQALHAVIGTADVLIMAAAPADYRPSQVSSGKLPRSSGALSIALEPTADILMSTHGKRKPGSVIVGFALETEDPLTRAAEKLDRKKLDMIVVNDAREPGAGFDVDTNRVTILPKGEEPLVLPLLSKREVAEKILEQVELRLGR